MSVDILLADLGWSSFFGCQLSLDDDDAIPVRVAAVHRDRLRVLGTGLDCLIPPFRGTANDEESAATVGDWLLLDTAKARARRLLRRFSLFKRRAAGTAHRLQLLAANVNTLLIVSSCNQDFSPPRLERYLALAREAQVQPVIILTKADLTDSPAEFAHRAAGLAPGVLVEALDARDTAAAAALAPWCARGQTVALAGSSGVGKSTLVNTLTGVQAAATQGLREKDDKGRHTTTARSLHPMPCGAWLVDTPGMRELALAEASVGLEAVFTDIAALAGRCHFSDCRHESEPGCAVNAAIAAGELDPDRLRRYRKLVAEELYNSETLAQRRARQRAFGALGKKVMQEKRRRREE